MSAVDEVREVAEAVVQRRSLRLWDVEVGGQPGRSIVRVLVDGENGVDIDTVAEVSEEISRALDLRDPLAGRYTLEVSSPGVERTLKSAEHFEACVGERVVVKTHEPLAGTSHRIDGEIAAAGADAFSVRLEDGSSVEVPYDAVKSARTVFEWN